MVELAAVIAALSAYRARLKADGKLLKGRWPWRGGRAWCGLGGSWL